MDFHSLARRDLQFFCKKNKIPANLTNVAMADALKALEIVEGLDEFANQSEATCHQSPTSVAKSTARTAARTTRRTATKGESQSSVLLTRSCLVTSKSLAGEMDQENRSTNALQNSALPPSRRSAAPTSLAKKLEATDVNPEANVSNTPAARSTRRSAAASSMKNESIQRVYSTRRSVKLLEESMADLSLKTNVPAKKNENVEQVDSPREKYPEGSQNQTKSDDNLEETKEAEVISRKDLNASLEMEWDMKDEGLKSDSGSMDLGDISFLDANTNKEQMNEIESNTVSDINSFVVVEEKETSQDEDFVVINHAASSTTKESETKLNSETEQINNDPESELINIDSESESEADTKSETYPEEDFSIVDDSNQEAFESDANKVDSVTTVLIDDDISKEVETESDYWSEEGEPEDIEIDSELEQALGSDKNTQAMELESESEQEEEEAEKKTTESSRLEAEPISVQFPRPNKTATTPTKDNMAAPLVADIEKNKENLGMNVEQNNNGEKMKMKKKKIDEDKLQDASLRQLLKMVKKLAIKEGNNKSALQILPDNPIAE